MQGYLDYINGLPATDTPEVFGLHGNADITYQINTAKGINVLFLHFLGHPLILGIFGDFQKGGPSFLKISSRTLLDKTDNIETTILYLNYTKECSK